MFVHFLQMLNLLLKNFAKQIKLNASSASFNSVLEDQILALAFLFVYSTGSEHGM